MLIHLALLLIILAALHVGYSQIITTIAGTGTGSYSGDGNQATSATLNGPRGVALDSSGILCYLCNFASSFLLILLIFLSIGNVFIADYSNQRIRKITVSTDTITTIAGSSTSASYSGDNDAATLATLNNPIAVGLDTSGK